MEFCNSVDEIHILTREIDGIIGHINKEIRGRWADVQFQGRKYWAIL